MMTSLDCDLWPTLIGRQEPEYLLADDGDQSEAEKALKFYRRIKKPLMPWQEAGTRRILSLEPDGLFTHPTCAEVVARQNGKTLADADLRILWGLFFRGEKIVYSAQRWKTAESIFNRLNRLIKSRPSLNARVVRRTCSQGQASLELESGASAEFITRSLDSGRGLDEIDLIIYDESYNLKDAETAALSPTQMASKNPQTIYLSSAVNQEMHANGVVLSGIRYRALEFIKSGGKRTGLYYAEYAAPEPPEGCSDAERRALRENPETWIIANPSYGVIQNEAKVRKLLLELGPKAFEVEVLSWGDWPPVSEDGLRVITADKWRDMADTMPLLVTAYPQVLGVDRSPTSKVWAIAGAIRTRSGHVHAELGWSGMGSPSAVAERLIDVITDADPAALVIDQRSPAATLLPYLTEAGVEPHMTNTTELALACAGVIDAADADQLTHSGQQILDDSLASTTKRPLPGNRFAWDGSQIAQFQAFTLAHWGLLTFTTPPENTADPVVDSAEMSENDQLERDFDAMSAPF